jgi:hypothetical protein
MTKPLGEDLSNNDNEKPKSLQEEAEKATQRVFEMKEDFSSQYHGTMKAKDEVRKGIEVVQRIVARGKERVNPAAQLLIKLGVDQNQVDALKRKTHTERDASLYAEDFNQVRDFYGKILKLIEGKNDKDIGGLTNNEFIQEVVKLFQDDSMWKELMEKKELGFEEKMRQMLSGKMKADEINLFETTLIDAIPKQNVAHEIENIFMVLRMLCGQEGKLIPLTQKSAPGMIGRVLPKEQADAVFEKNDVSLIQDLDSAGIEISLATQRFYFYHKKGQDDLPSEAKKLIQDPVDPSKILLVHYYKDSDMQNLFADMSDGQQLVGTVRDSNEPLVIEGISNNDDIVFIQTPASWNEAIKSEFLESPMKYMSTDFSFKNAQAASQNGATGNPIKAEQKLLEDKKAK